MIHISVINQFFNIDLIKIIQKVGVTIHTLSQTFQILGEHPHAPPPAKLMIRHINQLQEYAARIQTQIQHSF